MKYLFTLSFIAALCHPTWAEPTHPLKEVAHSIYGTLGDLNEIYEDKTVEQNDQFFAKKLRDQTQKLYLRTLFVQINWGHDYLKSVGITIKFIGMRTHQLETGPEYKALREKARAMNPEGWEQFRTANLRLIEASRIAHDTHFNRSGRGRGGYLSEGASDHISWILHLYFYEHYQDLAKLGERVLGCIDYFGKAYATTGLKPEWTGSEFVWSKPELFKVFRVRDINELNPTAKAQVLGTLNEYTKKMYQFKKKCGAEYVNDFFHAEFRRLGGQP